MLLVHYLLLNHPRDIRKLKQVYEMRNSVIIIPLVYSIIWFI